MELSKINANIRAIRTASAKVDNLVQLTLLGAMIHADNTGDISAINRLIDAMGRSMRRDSATSYLCYFFPVEVSQLDTDSNRADFFTINGKRYAVSLKKNRKPEDFKHKEAAKKHWSDFKPENKPLEVDIPKALETLLKRATDAAAGKVGKDGRKATIGDTSKALIPALQAFVKAVEDGSLLVTPKKTKKAKKAAPKVPANEDLPDMSAPGAEAAE